MESTSLHPGTTSNHSVPSKYNRMATMDTGGPGASEPTRASLTSAAATEPSAPDQHVDGASGHDDDIEGLPSEAFSASSQSLRQPSPIDAFCTPDAASHVNQMLAEGASAKTDTTVADRPGSSFWRTRRFGQTGADDEEEPLTNLQAEAFSYVMFQDAESTGDTCTTAKTAMASSAFELVSSMKQLQYEEGAGHPKAARPLLLLGSVAKVLPSYLPVVSSIKGGHKQQSSASSGSSGGAHIQSVTTVFEDEPLLSDPSDASIAAADRLSPSDRKILAKLLAGLQAKVNQDEASAARGEDFRNVRDEPLGSDTKTEMTREVHEAYTGFAGGKFPQSIQGVDLDKDLTSDQKFECLVEGFGPIPEVLSALGEERFLGDHIGAVLAEVGLIGHFALTTHRLFFIAYIPCMEQQAVINARSSTDQEDVVAAPGKSEQLVGHLVMKSGPAYQHRRIVGIPSAMRSRRVWLELRSEGLFVFASSEVAALYEPLEILRFEDLLNVESVYSPSKANFLTLSLKNSDGTKRDLAEFEFGTRVGALIWRRELRSALFRSQFSANLVRLTLPLAQITGVDQLNSWHSAKLDIRLPQEGIQKRVLIAERQEGKIVSLVPSPELVTNIASGRTNSVTIAFMGSATAGAAFIGKFMDALSATLAKNFVREKLLPDNIYTAYIEGGNIVEQVAKAEHLPQGDQEHVPTRGFTKNSGLSDEETAELAREFAIDPTSIRAAYRAQLWRNKIPTRGSLCIASDYLCFIREHHLSEDYRLRISTTHLTGAEAGAKLLTFSSLIFHIKGHEDVWILFGSSHERDAVLTAVNTAIEDIRARLKAAAHHTQSHRQTHVPISKALQPTLPSSSLVYVPKVVNADNGFLPRIPPRRFCIAVIGSRGDVQPLIVLGRELMEHHHTVRIVSHPEYEDWIRGHGLDFAAAGGDPGALMKLSVEHRLFSPAFFRDSISKFRVWLDDLLREMYEGCYDADVIIEAPQTMAGIHVAERLGVPYFRVFTMPWTKTSAYPQAFSVPPVDLGPSYNAMSYTLFDQVFWTASSGQINRWRKHMLGLKPTDLSQLDQANVPFVYNFSPAVVPVPNDWDDNICVSGYWFLDTKKSDWDPPQDLVAFLKEGRKHHKKLAYCGFGSIVVSDPDEMTRNLYAAVEKAGVYAVIAKGWSSRGQKEGKVEKEPKGEIPVPKCCYVVDSIPHDWLFPQIDIALHHGGAGTTGASLRAGLVTAIKPFFGDQFFWGQRVEKLGAGVRVNSLSTHDLASALKKASEDRIMVEKAEQVGASIYTENGPDKAIQFIYANIERARRQPRFRDDLRILRDDKLVFYSDDSSDFVEDSDDTELETPDGTTLPEGDKQIPSPTADAEAHQVQQVFSPTPSSNAFSATTDTEDKGHNGAVAARLRSLIHKPGQKFSLSSDQKSPKASSSPKLCPSPSSRPKLLPNVPGLPGLDNLPNFTLASAFRQMCHPAEEEEADTEENKAERKRAVQSIALEHQTRARHLLPKQIELALAHRLAQRMYDQHIDDSDSQQ